MSTDRIRSMQYNGVTIFFVKMSDVWLVVVKNLGYAIGYSGNGRRLVASAAKWAGRVLAPIDFNSMKGDISLLVGERLDEFLKLVPDSALSAESGTTPSLSVLTLQGARKILTKANVPGAKILRDRWDDVTSALTNNTLMPVFEAIEVGEKTLIIKNRRIKGRATVPPPDNGNDDIQKLHTLGAALHEQVELGNLTDEQVKWLMMKAATALVSKYCNIPIDIGQNQQRILKPIPLVDMALTDDVIAKSGGFTMSSPLPKKLEGWMTATDLGQKLHPTQEAESVGHYIPIIFEEEFGVGTEMRANKIAANRRIASSMAVFEQYKDPESGLVMVPNDKGDCIALYAQNLATGGFNWRNFYSPERSKWLLEKLEEKYAERAQSKNKKPKTVQAQAPFVPVPLPPPFRRDPPDGNGVK